MSYIETRYATCSVGHEPDASASERRSIGKTYINRLVLFVMGNSPSYVVNAGVGKLAFKAPPCGYTLGQCEMVYTISAERVATRLFTPLGNVLCPTKQRWIARRQYDDSRLLFIFSHGNADDLQTSAVYSQWLADTFDVNVLGYDYKGYGNSEAGMTTKGNMQEAIEAVYNLAVTRMAVPVDRIVLMGKSLGTGPTVHIASQSPCAVGVILVSPLASGARTLFDTKNVPRAVMAGLDQVFMPSVQRMASIQMPTCIIHGTEDTLIGVDNARALEIRCRSQAAYPALYVRAGHNDIETLHAELFVEHVRAFLQHAERMALFTQTERD